MKTKRIISILLAVLMLASAFSVSSFAGDAEEVSGHIAQPEEGWKTSNLVPTIDYVTGQGVTAITNKEGDVTGYEPDGNKIITSPEAKLATMDLRFVKDGYELYVDAYSGEIACRCIATGEVLFSNPYTVGDSTATKSIKSQLLSQLVVKYVDIATGDDNTYYSYEWAASRGQIVVRNIKNGIRVEYTIGREEARMLVPRHIEKSSFEAKILNVMAAAVEGDPDATFMYKKLMAYYSLNDLSTVTSQTLKDAMMREFPITKKMAIYVLDNSTSSTEMAKIEQLIKTYCPDYSYEDLDDDHMLTEYESEDKNPPLFKMALEYSLDENGLVVRLPANGIRFNEALYQLYSLEILPYMGAGANPNSGYTFFPDGSGTLFDFEKIADLGASTTVTGKVYGKDFAYHTISGTHQEILRYPVFGVVETEELTREVPITDAEGGVAVAAEEGATTDGAATDGTTTDGATTEGEATEGETTEPVIETETVTYYKDRGFVAIVEEGDALMELSSYHAVRTSEYNTVRMIVYPRPQDTYNVADSISVGQNDTWTVVSSRKYTGNYKIRYIMLTDDAVAAEKGVADYYECSYVGMAKAYREYLENKGVLTRLADEDVKEDIPLYIETFGALETTERFLSIPLEVMTPLTTFDDIKTMYDELSTAGVENINFILTGYAKGGISQPQVPYNLKWDSAVVEDMDFEDLVAYAREQGFGVYPDFDFAYVKGNGMFDGLSLKNHAVKTIDDRYSSKREYSATKQTYVSYFELAVSPAYFSHFYEKLTEKYLKYDPMGISVSTLGNSLNSDFDEDDPYNREDSKEFTVKAFEYFAENYGKVMTSGGNAYTWGYVDYITDIALDSSRYAQSSASVPFLGMVLHGYVEIAGTPINMEGNIDYAVLKAIENGASLKFILSYQNTNNLKNSIKLSQYYSVRYDIWLNDVIDLYNEVNGALAGVQTSVITDHKFENGVRVPDDDELVNDAKNALDAAISGDAAAKDKANQAEKDAYREAKLNVEAIYERYQNIIKSISSSDPTNMDGYNKSLENFMGTSFTVDYYYCDACAAEKTPLDDPENPDLKICPDCVEPLRLVKSIKEYTSYIQSLIDKINDANNTESEVADFKNELEAALQDYTAKYTDLVLRATGYLGEWVTLGQDIVLAKTEYKALLEADYAAGNLPKVQYDALMAKIDELDISKFYPTGITDPQVLADSVVAKVNEIKDKINEYITTLTATGAILETSAEMLPLIEREFKYGEDEDTKVDSAVTEDTKITTPTYTSDESKIARVVYENGTTFLLNFNNYKVRVGIKNDDGSMSYYTLDAYGYIILKQGN